MRIGLDIDEVVCRLVPKVLASIKKFWDVTHTIDVFANHNFFDNAYTECDKTNKDIANDIVKWVNDSDYLHRTSPYPGVGEFIRSLMDDGHEVHFITARPESALKATATWLHKNNIPYTSLNVIGLVNCKGELGKELSLDIYVDDHVDNLVAMAENVKVVNFIVDRPWNTYYNAENVIRIKTLQELGGHLDVTRNNKEGYGRGR